MTISPDISPDILDAATTDPAAPAWKLIWVQSCHQGTCSPASVHLLPWLAQTCAAFAVQQRQEALALAGFIAVDATDADRARYAEPIAALRALAVESRHEASSDSMFVYLQQAVLGLDGDETWGKQLDLINDGEIDVQCPDCAEELLVDLTSDEPQIEPGLSCALAVRLHTEAVEATRDTVATALTHLFGRIACPGCGFPFSVAEHLAGVSYE